MYAATQTCANIDTEVNLNLPRVWESEEGEEEEGKLLTAAFCPPLMATGGGGDEVEKQRDGDTKNIITSSQTRVLVQQH